MTYRKLGRTGFMSSRLVFGCGAALAGGRAVRLLDRAFEAGINHFDVGSERVYRGAERSMVDFLKKHRDQIFLVSKTPLYARINPYTDITKKIGNRAAAKWTRELEKSLKNLQVDYLDSYYMMSVDNEGIVQSEELYQAFLTAKNAGKVGFWGFSTHKYAEDVLTAAIDTGWYDLAMIGITPAGWYDWDSKELVEDTPTLKEAAPLLQKARDAGIGLIGMKTVRYLAGEWVGGQGDDEGFDDVYDEKFLKNNLSPFQRAYVFALEHGLDVVNADMQNYDHLEENITAAATSKKYFG